MAETARRILDQLLQTRQLDADRYQQYLALAQKDTNALIKALNEDSQISAEALAQAKGIAISMPYANLEGKEISMDVLNILPQDLAENYQMLVFGKEGHKL